MTIIDSRFWGDRDGYVITATTVADDDTRLDDYEAYTADPAIVESWRKDHWHFVGVRVTASREGVALGEATVWGVEYGLFPVPGEPVAFSDPLDRPQDWIETVDEAVAAADAKLVALTASHGPVIMFDDPDGLVSVLTYANLGLATKGWLRDGDGLTYDFHLADGAVVNGTFHHEDHNGDAPVIVIATHQHGSPDGGRVEVPLHKITRIVYC